MDLRLDGRVALVTGGSKGIGKAIAAAMVVSGAKVMISSRKEENLKPEPEIQKIAPLFLVKGETRKVRHGLNWKQYLKDDLTVKVEVSDKEALTVLPELKLNADNNLADFTYEVRVGQKPGDFTITLTPEVGTPVVVKVNVK